MKYILINRIKKGFLRRVEERPTWHILIYISAYIYNITLHFLPQSCTARPQSIRKVLIIYSKYHFDPENDSPTRPFAHGSAGNIARNIYSTLKRDGVEVIYRDQHEPLINITDADMVLGILSNSFYNYCRLNIHAQKILFLVNSHPLFRIKELLKEAFVNGTRIPRHEYVSPFLPLRCFKIADKLILIGNDFVKNTFASYGTFGKEISLVQSGVNADLLVPNFALLPHEKIRILFCATSLGLRKGIFRLMSLWEKIGSRADSGRMELVLVGENSFFKNIVDAFIAKHQNVIYKGWVDSTMEEYRKILQSSHIVLGLSLEEGQVGTILEAMSTGAVPIVTSACGIPIEHGREGYIFETYDEGRLIAHLEMLAQDKELLAKMRQRTRECILQSHTWDGFRKNIVQAIY